MKTHKCAVDVGGLFRSCRRVWMLLDWEAGMKKLW